MDTISTQISPLLSQKEVKQGLLLCLLGLNKATLKTVTMTKYLFEAFNKDYSSKTIYTSDPEQILLYAREKSLRSVSLNIVMETVPDATEAVKLLEGLRECF